MPGPIDLSQIPGRSPAPRPSNGRKGSGPSPGIAVFQEFARKVTWIALLVSILLLAYLLVGLYSGAWAKAPMQTLYHANRASYFRQVSNIEFVFHLLQLSAFLYVACLIAIAYVDESLGYVLTVFGLIFYAGLPWLTARIYDLRSYETDMATQGVMRDFQLLSWLFFMPGLALIVADLFRRFRTAAETAALQKVNVKYGRGIKKQVEAKHKNVFLGRCFEGPYCRPEIRVHCPIFLRKRGPCWHYKEGCMCEERIVLQAVINPEWKHQAAQTKSGFNFGEKRKKLSPAELRERCRNCIIYNEHQRQKYKAMVAVTLIAFPVLAALNSTWLESAAQYVLVSLDNVMQRFSFDATPSSNAILHTAGLEWALIGAICVILLAQVLKFIEYWCFKIKI